VSTEATVIAVAAAIYLVDCAVLLERGQALWTRSGLAFGSLHYQVRGRAVALLNPFTPFVAPLRTRPLLGLAFGWLVCLPLSINALRKAALAFEVAIDAREAIGLLPEGDRARARGELAAQIAEAMQELDESDERHQRLAELKVQLAAQARP